MLDGLWTIEHLENALRANNSVFAWHRTGFGLAFARIPTVRAPLTRYAQVLRQIDVDRNVLMRHSTSAR